MGVGRLMVERNGGNCSRCLRYRDCARSAGDWRKVKLAFDFGCAQQMVLFFTSTGQFLHLQRKIPPHQTLASIRASSDHLHGSG
jgi:hypothetical protein